MILVNERLGEQVSLKDEVCCRCTFSEEWVFGEKFLQTVFILLLERSRKLGGRRPDVFEQPTQQAPFCSAGE